MSNRILVVIIIIIIILDKVIVVIIIFSYDSYDGITIETIFTRTFPSIYLWVMLMSALWNIL